MRRERDRLQDIASAVQDMLALIEGLTREEFDALPSQDIRSYRAVKNAVAEIGEAVKALPDEVRNRHPDVDWRGLVAIRNIVVHRYFEFELPRLWPGIKEHFPRVLAAVREELARLEGDQERGRG